MTSWKPFWEISQALRETEEHSKLPRHCEQCKDGALDRPKRADALGECQAWFYGYKLVDGSRYIIPGTPAAM